MPEPLIHSIDPIAFTVFGFGVRWYSLSYIVSILIALHCMGKNARAFGVAWSQKLRDDLMVASVLGMVIGGKLGYMLLYELPYGRMKLSTLLSGHGLSFHGGLAGVVIGVWLASKGHSRARIFDLCASVTPIGIFLVRLGNFANGELFGRPTTLPWGMIFPSGGDLLPRHPSQIYEAMLEGLCVFLVVRLISKTALARQNPGITTASFSIFYGLARAFAEFFREPDGHIGFFGSLTYGQLLSVPLVLIGVGILTYALKLKRAQKVDR